MNQSNVPSSRSVARNASLLTGAYILQKVFAFVYFTFVARWTSPNEVGKYVFAVSLTTILAIFMDLGLTPILIREASKYREKASQYLNVILGFKLILGIVLYAFALILVRLLGKDELIQSMVALTGIAMVLDSFSTSFWGVFRAFHNLRYESYSIIGNQILITIVGLLGLYFKFPLTILALALLTGSLFSFIFSFGLLIRKRLVSLRLTFFSPLLKGLILMALPFALAGIFTRVYSYIDQVLLSIMIGDKELGWYSVAYKITFALQFVPSAFAAAIFPAMSNYFQHAPEKLRTLFEKSMFILSLIAIPLAAGIFVIAPKIIFMLYGQRYESSILPLQILILALPAVFLSFPNGSILNSSNRQHINTANLGLTMVINIVLNLILIPPFKHVGAAIAASISLYFLFFSNLYFVGRVTQYGKLTMWKNFFVIILISTIMAAAVNGLLGLLGLLPSIAVGVIIYCLLALGLRVITIPDIRQFISLIVGREPEPQPVEPLEIN